MSVVFPKWKEARLQGTANAALDGTGTTGLYAALIDTGVYTYNAADEFWDEGGANDAKDGLIGTLVELTSKTYTNGVLDAANITVPTVSGNTAEAIILVVKNTGAETTWRLFAYIDSAVSGLPVTPNTGNVDIAWHASGIVAL